jgi:hypothetical protein
MSDDGPDTDQLVQIHESRLDALDDAIDKLEQKVEQQARRIGQLEALVDPDPGTTAYEQLSKDQKVRHVRQHLVDVAKSNGGKASLQYREIKTLFDGHPSPGHCYDLMRSAGAIDGFEYDENGSGNKRIRCNAAAVKDEQYFHAANKASGAGAV